MKKYIKPVAECYNVETENVIATSVGLSDTAADPSYTGGGDAKIGNEFFDFEEED